MSLPPLTYLSYSISDSSGHSGNYIPDGILVNDPTNINSRWCGTQRSPTSSDWLLLKLQEPSVLTAVTFGKYHREHPCTMRKCKIYVGMSPDHLSEATRAFLTDSIDSETLPVRHTLNGEPFLTQYVKIVPLTATKENYNISIWHVSLCGISDASYISNILQMNEKRREEITYRYILKHLRQKGLNAAFNSVLENVPNISLESPFVSQLYAHIQAGSWDLVESQLNVISSHGLLDAYRKSALSVVTWARLSGTDSNGDIPSARVGNAICIDTEGRTIYYHGGRLETQNLNDFWVYNIDAGSWSMISQDTAIDINGPLTCRGHSMVFDEKTGDIYMLGRRPPSPELTDVKETDSTPSRQGLFRYRTKGPTAGTWDIVQEDTASAGGPSLLKDHQMVIDCEAQVIYIFGGIIKTLPAGLYVYSIPKKCWKMLQPGNTPSNPFSTSFHIPGRTDHSMTFLPRPKSVLIYGGQSLEGVDVSDAWMWNIEMESAHPLPLLPKNCSSQQIVYTGGREIILITNTNLLTSPDRLPNQSSFTYVIDTKTGKLSELRATGEERPKEPRLMGHAVYDPLLDAFFIPGGWDGVKYYNDFWSVKRSRLSREEVVRRMIFLVRQQQFREMCTESSPIVALQFLQSNVSSVVDHAVPEEAATFRMLMENLIASPEVSGKDGAQGAVKREQRIKVFQELLRFINEDTKEPTGSLVDLVDAAFS